MDGNDFSFGTVLRSARKRNGLTINRLAEIMDVTRFTIRNWEGNINKPDYDSLIRLCTVLSLPITDLFPSLCGFSPFEHEIIQDLRHMSPEKCAMAAAIIKTLSDFQMDDEIEIVEETQDENNICETGQKELKPDL